MEIPIWFSGVENHCNILSTVEWVGVNKAKADQPVQVALVGSKSVSGAFICVDKNEAILKSQMFYVIMKFL